jgi:dipeptidyl-peptidase 4
VSTATNPGESFPRQKATTRGFRLGAPRAFALDPNGARVVFIRSSGGRDPVGDLWCTELLNGAWTERLICDARTLASGKIPAAELARRERLREVTSGITAFSVDEQVRTATFALDGIPYLIDVTTPGAVAQELEHPGPCIDPRISPNGELVAYVHDRSLFVVTKTGAPQLILEAESENITYGLADFIAAEELERHRGFWWLADSSGLLVEKYDESSVQVQWIADLASPTAEPVPHRYPAAGTANPIISLHLAKLGSAPVNLDWDAERFPYLATVSASTKTPLISVLNRAQTTSVIYEVNFEQATLIERASREQLPWITLIPGVPALDSAGRLIEVIPDSGAFRLHRDGIPLSPPGVQVDAVLDIASDIFLSIQNDPTTSDLALIDESGGFTQVTDGNGWHGGIRKGELTLISRADLATTTSRVTVHTQSEEFTIESNAEVSIVSPKVHLHELGAQHLRAAVLFPTDHTPGAALPVICSPYGGPHAARVISAAAAFTTEQWLADQGFAVVVIDGRGTPGRGPDWEFAIAGNLADPVLEDQVSGLQSLAELYPDLDLTRVGIRGWSFGGYLAALAVLDRPDVFHAAVAGAPVTEWRLYDTGYTERYLGLPAEKSDDYDNSSLLTRAHQLTRPLLLIHGLADDNVVAAHTLQMSSALLAAGKAHNVLPLSGVTHMTPQEIVAENLLLTEVEFFQNNLNRD